jgi:hypothetical protein
MKSNIALLILLLLTAAATFGQTEKSKPEIYTVDVYNFWQAYDLLPSANNRADSLAVFQIHYLDKASEGFRKFIKVRSLTADKYADAVKAYSPYYASIRNNSTDLSRYEEAIAIQFEKYDNTLRKFKPPKVCFAVGVLSTGGTVKNGWLLLGTEMMVADSNAQFAVLNNWHRLAIGTSPQVEKFIAHETVHTQQRFGLGLIWAYLNHRLLTMSIVEGSADFVAEKVTGSTINEGTYAYGSANEDVLKKDFYTEMLTKNTRNWLYSGNNTQYGVADLGYFMGYKICEAYYDKADDKTEAINTILKTNRYKKLLRKSGYMDDLKQ